MAAKKKGRKSYRELASANSIDYAKITLDNVNFSRLYHGALQELYYEAKDADLKREAIQYAQTYGLNTKALRALEDRALAVVGKYCTIVNHGGQLPSNVEQSLLRRLKEREAQGELLLNQKQETQNASLATVSIQDRVREQVEPIMEVFDVHLDHIRHGKRKNKTNQELDPLAIMQKADFKAAHAAWVKKFAEPEVQELAQVLEGQDPDLKEGYSTYSQRDIKRMLEFWERVIQAANLIAQSTKAQRKPRAKKQPSREKIIKGLKFCSQFSELGLSSINPVDVLGAQELWVYHTKHRKLGRYVAMDAAGLGVKGTTITNVATEASVQKTLRRPSEQMGQFASLKKNQLNGFFDNIKGVTTKLNGRINSHVILLKVR